MSTNFQTKAFQGTYTGRSATPSWLDFMQQHVRVKDRRVLDVGCGGGIYSRALLKLGAKRVTGVDSSEVSLRDARVQPAPNLDFVDGDATALPFKETSFDLVLARALVHHLDSEGLGYFAMEVRRCLTAEGVLVVQDRTVEDALAPGTSSNPRGYLYDFLPDLRELETGRRYSDQAVREAFGRAGFAEVERFSLWEQRKVYVGFDELRAEVLARRGRSILHELSDQQLQAYAEFLGERLAGQAPIVEREPWTVWVATLHR